MKRIRCNSIILPDSVLDGYVYFDGEKIVDVTDREYAANEEYDLRGYNLSAGFIDIHTHGGGGCAFEGTLDEIVGGCAFHLLHGTTSICPTVSCAPVEDMSASVRRIKEAMSDPRVKSTVLGAHLEGPYLSLSQTGAQSADFITEPKEEEYLPLLDELSDAIARWTYAPERDGGSFINALSSHSIVASAGHTDAIYDDILRAYDGGLRLVTHLYSCTSTVTRDHGFRRLGVIESAYLLDGMYVEIIADGRHLPPELIRLIYKIKGADRICMITDSLSLAGTEETHGFMQNTEFIIEDGVCKLMDRSAFAGSIATADRLLRIALKDAGIPLVDAVKMLTLTPARVMGLDKKGRIAPDMDADLVAFDSDVNIKAVFARGECVKYV